MPTLKEPTPARLEDHIQDYKLGLSTIETEQFNLVKAAETDARFPHPKSKIERSFH